MSCVRCREGRRFLSETSDTRETVLTRRVRMERHGLRGRVSGEEVLRRSRPAPEPILDPGLVGDPTLEEHQFTSLRRTNLGL